MNNFTKCQYPQGKSCVCFPYWDKKWSNSTTNASTGRKWRYSKMKTFLAASAFLLLILRKLCDKTRICLIWKLMCMYSISYLWPRRPMWSLHPHISNFTLLRGEEKENTGRQDIFLSFNVFSYSQITHNTTPPLWPLISCVLFILFSSWNYQFGSAISYWVIWAIWCIWQ